MKITIVMDDFSGMIRNVVAHHGFSALVELENTKILVDTGANGEDLLKNFEVLGIDISEINTVFLTHRHYDHTGGLKKLLEERNKIGKKTFVVAHPDLFVPLFSSKPFLRESGLPFTKEELESLGAVFLLVEEPFEMTPGVFSTGLVEREERYERIGDYFRIVDGKLVKDNLPDDMSLVIKSEKGLVIVAGCSHAGIVNIVKHASRVFNESVFAVIGGFHLVGLEKDQIEDIVLTLKNLGVKRVFAGHCTGFDALCVFNNVFEDNFARFHVGSIIEI